MSSSVKTMLASALVAFAFSIGANIGIGPSTAWAQTATDLNCKKCVRGKAIKNGAVKFNRLQGKVQNRITGLESATTALQSTASALEARTSALETIAMERVPFYVVLDGDGAEQTIATNGALEYFARCRVDDAGSDRIQIIVTSTQDGWFEEDAGGPQAAGAEIIQFTTSTGLATPIYSDDIDEGSAVAPDGSYVGIDGEMTGLGLNIFGHDCIAVGNVFLVNGTP